MVDWALSFWVDLATALYPEYRSEIQVRTQEEVRESAHCDFVLLEGFARGRRS